MRIRWIGIALVAFSLLGTAMVTQFLIRNEQKYSKKDILSKGKYLASLIALYPVEDYQGKKRESFIRTFREYLFSEKLLYCLVHDIEGQLVLELAPQGLSATIPKDVQMSALHSMGLITRTFKLDKSEYPIYEFAKPIINSGRTMLKMTWAYKKLNMAAPM